MNDSIFSKIVRGEIPSHKIYEDKRTYAFLDIHPSVQGHTLVIPKKQVEFLWDLEDEEYRAVMDTVKKVARHLRSTLDVPYVGVKVIGTDVPHAHVQLIPFTTAQEYEHFPNMNQEPDHTVLAKIAVRLML